MSNPRTIDELELYKFWNYAKISYPCTFEQFKQKYLDNGYIVYSIESEGIPPIVLDQDKPKEKPKKV